MIGFDVFVFSVYFLYYLWNLTFVGKNLAYRLPRMKSVVSIMSTEYPLNEVYSIYIYIYIYLYIYIYIYIYIVNQLRMRF